VGLVLRHHVVEVLDMIITIVLVMVAPHVVAILEGTSMAQPVLMINLHDVTGGFLG
jgi:hypothetical protein